jgi:hypothetical protein
LIISHVLKVAQGDRARIYIEFQRNGWIYCHSDWLPVRLLQRIEWSREIVATLKGVPGATAMTRLYRRPFYGLKDFRQGALAINIK